MEVKQVFQCFGLGRAVPYYAYKLARRCCTLDITHLQLLDAEEALPIETLDEAFEFRQLTAEDVCRFADDPANDLDVSLAFRLRLGKDHCYAALHGGRLAGYCWVALDSIEGPLNRGTEDPRSGIALSYPRGYGFRYKGFTHPDFRGRRIYQQLTTFASRALWTHHGVRYQLSTAEWVNYPALRASRRSGFQYLGLVLVFGWGDYILRRGPRSVAQLGIRLGRQADVVCREQLAREQEASLPAMQSEHPSATLQLAP